MSNMSVIDPTIITDSVLISSNVPENDYPVYSATTTYGISTTTAPQRVISTVTHRVYESVRASNLNHDPTDPANLAGATPWWVDIGPTNRWAMFDRKVGTLTSRISPLTVVLQPGGVSGLGTLEMMGRSASITMTDVAGGAVVYSKTVILDGTSITSFYDWFTADYEQLSDFALTDLPQLFTRGQLTISVIGTGTVSCGVLQVGKVLRVGNTQYGATVGIIDYSRKNKDIFGNVDVLERGFSKRNSLKVMTKKSDFNRIYRRLASFRARPCFYIGTEEPGFEPLLIYGFYKDFSIDIAYPLDHLCNIEIEGLNT